MPQAMVRLRCESALRSAASKNRKGSIGRLPQTTATGSLRPMRSRGPRRPAGADGPTRPDECGARTRVSFKHGGGPGRAARVELRPSAQRAPPLSRHDHADLLRQQGARGHRRRRARRHAAPVDPARQPEPHRHQVRLRHGAVRRVHRLPRRPADARVRDAAVGAQARASRSPRSKASARRKARPCRPRGRSSTCRNAAIASRAR